MISIVEQIEEAAIDYAQVAGVPPKYLIIGDRALSDLHKEIYSNYIVNGSSTPQPGGLMAITTSVGQLMIERHTRKAELSIRGFIVSENSQLQWNGLRRASELARLQYGRRG